MKYEYEISFYRVSKKKAEISLYVKIFVKKSPHILSLSGIV